MLTFHAYIIVGKIVLIDKKLYERKKRIILFVSCFYQKDKKRKYFLMEKLITKFKKKEEWIPLVITFVYLRHHYIIDVLLGIVYAFIAYFVFEWLVRHTRIKIWFEKLSEKI